MMRGVIRKIAGMALLCCAALAQAQSGQDLVAGARDMVETQRRILALHEARGGDEQARTVAGQFLFHSLQDKGAALSRALAQATQRNDTVALNAFFDYMERGELFDLDRL